MSHAGPPPISHHGDVIDLVLPLALRRHGNDDVERCRMLLRSLELYFDPGSLGTLYVVCQEDCRDEIERRLRDFRLPMRFIDERDVIGKTWICGWRKQQLIKLAIADRCTDFYLVLDADLVGRRRVRYADLVRDGRGVVGSLPRSTFKDWHRDSAAMLGIDSNLSGDDIGVTPQVLNREVVSLLARHLERRYRRPWLATLGSSERWTEFTLYGLLIERYDLFDLFHVWGQLSGGNVWDRKDFEGWSLDSTAPGYFSVVQSNTGVGPDVVRRRIEQQLPLDA